jgi:hypothetical protein
LNKTVTPREEKYKMKVVYRLAMIVALILLLGSDESASAKNWIWYIDFTNVVSGSPGYIDVVIAIKANSTGDVGNLGNFAVLGTMSSAIYDFNSGHDPVLQAVHLAGNYTVTRSSPPGSYNWQLNGALNSGSGDQVPLTGILVATLRFYVSNPSGSSSIAYINLQQTYQDDYITRVTVTYDNTGGNVPLPIQMASFTASVVRDNDVEVTWKTVSETNNYGFEIYRKRAETGEWKKITFVEGHGTTLTPQVYSYTDRAVGFGKYSYQIKQIDLNGKSSTYGGPEMGVVVGVAPGQFVLAQNYPNPFNPSTVIEFVVPQSGLATVKVYNVLGQEVATVFQGNAEVEKINTAQFNASNLPSAMYFYTLKSAGKTETKRMLLMK